MVINVKPPDNNKERNAWNRLLNVAAYPASVLIGSWFTKHKIEKETYDSITFHDGLKDLKEPLTENAKQIGQEAVKRVNQGECVDLYKEVKPIHQKYATQVEKRMEQLHLGSVGKRWRFLQKHQKQSVVLHGLKATAISLGVILTIVNAKDILDLLRKKEHESEHTNTR